MNNIIKLKNTKLITQLLFSTIFLTGLTAPFLHADTDVLIKDRKQFSKSIRTRMPPQIIIDAIQKDFQSHSPVWKTFWQTFVVEDDELKDEFVIIARSMEKPWAFGMLKEDCPKPVNYEDLKNQVETGGTPVRIDVLIGVKRKRSWFRYIINVYEPMYIYWKNPCYTWNLPPGKAKDDFYSKNYTMQVYAENLREKVYDLVKEYNNWKPSKQVKKIPAMKGSGKELIGGEAEELTDDEKKLSISEQEKIIEKRKKEKKK